MSFRMSAVILAAIAAFTVVATPTRREEVDLSGFRTVENAIQAKPIIEKTRVAGSSGYLGVYTTATKGGIEITEIEPGSPAELAGLKLKDLITEVNKKAPRTDKELRELLQAQSAGDSVEISYLRAKKKATATAKLIAVSRPRSLNLDQAVLGLQLGEAGSEGTPIRRVTPNSPADKAGLKTGDFVTKLEGTPLADPARLDSLLNEKKAGDEISLTYVREGKETEAKATLAEPTPVAGDNQTFVARNVWKKPVFRLAIVGIEYSDVKHNEQITTKNWSDSLFSTGTYTDKSATDQKVYGSMNDFYREVSAGAFNVEGKVFDWVQVTKERAAYSEGTGTSARSRGELFKEALTKLVERDGKDALTNYDGIFFVYAGGRFQTTRGGLYWPHRSSYRFEGKTWPYFIVPEGGRRMTDISVMCHEFGHMLGMPDLYARPENPGSEGLGTWCLMSNQAGAGRPQHMSAWCKVQLGWLTPTVIDPTVPQKLILAPVNKSKTECYKVLLRADGSEYLLLENRQKSGFDASLPKEGMLIWHILGNRPILEESHGVEGPAGPRVFVDSVPYPSGSNNAFTPFTIPSSRSQLGGGLAVNITNIRQLEDGRITFYIGYEFH